MCCTGECQTKDDGGDNGNAMKEKSNEQEIDLNKPQSGTLTSDGTQVAPISSHGHVMCANSGH